MVYFTSTSYLRVKKSTCMRCTQNKLLNANLEMWIRWWGCLWYPYTCWVSCYKFCYNDETYNTNDYCISDARTLFLRSKASYMPINLALHYLYSRHSFAWEELLAKWFPLPSLSWQCCLCRSEDVGSQPSKLKCPALLSSSTIIRKIVAGISALTPTEQMCSTETLQKWLCWINLRHGS